jgi:hypothetical protein
MEEREAIIAGASQGALAALGGYIGVMLRNEPTSWRHQVIAAVAAGFVGLLVGKLCHSAGVGSDMTFVCVGISGLVGAARTVGALTRLVERQLGVTFEAPKDAGRDDKPADPGEDNVQ